MAKQIFHLGAFVENIEGTVVNPENAVGTPDGDFTGNITGSWKAKWQIEAPPAPVNLSYLAEHKVRIHCRRANGDPTLDPILWRVRLLNATGQEVMDFLQCGQLSRSLGGIRVSASPDGKFRKPIYDISKRGSSSSNLPAFGRFLGTDAGDEITIGYSRADAMGTIVGVESEEPEVGFFPFSTDWASVVGSLSGSRNGDMLCAPSGTGPPVFYKRETEPGVWTWRKPTGPAGSAGWHCGFYSGTNRYVFAKPITTSSTFERFQLYRLDEGANELVDITPAALEGTRDDRRANADWVGNTMAASHRDGVYAFDWNEGDESVTPIAGIEGGQFLSTYSHSSVRLSDDGQTLAATESATAKRLHIIPVSNPAAARILDLGALGAHEIMKVEWLPGNHAVAIRCTLTDSRQNESYSLSRIDRKGYLLIVEVPPTGDLVVSSHPFEHHPMSLHWVGQMVRMGSDGLVFEGETTARQTDLARVMTAQAKFETPDLARAKSVLEIPGVFGPAAIAQQTVVRGSVVEGDFTVTSPVETIGLGLVGLHHPQWANNQPPPRLHQVLSPCGRFIARYNVGNNSYPSIAKGPALSRWEWDGALQELWKPAAFAPGTITGISWASDSTRVLFASDQLCDLDFDPVAETLSVTAYDAEWLKDGDTRDGAIRPNDKNLVFSISAVAPFYRVGVVEDGFLIDKTADYAGTGLDAITHTASQVIWSPDGEYLFVRGVHRPTATPHRLFKWNDGNPVHMPLPSFADNVHMFSWNPVENILCFSATTGWPSASSWLTILKMEGETATVLDVSGFFAQIQEMGADHSHGHAWSPDGKFISFHYVAADNNGWQEGALDGERAGHHIWEWDENKVATGLDKVATSLGWNGYGLGPKLDIQRSTEGHDSYSGFPSTPDGKWALAPPFGVVWNGLLHGASNEADYRNHMFESGWSIEIEAIGNGDNTIQLEGVELELDVNAFALPTPWNLDTIFITDVSARAVWDWGPEGEPPP